MLLAKVEFTSEMNTSTEKANPVPVEADDDDDDHQSCGADGDEISKSPESEKQISIDPISLQQQQQQQQREPAAIMQAAVVKSLNHLLIPPAATKSKFLSCSLPNSASSSPRFRITKQPQIIKKINPQKQSVISPLTINRQSSVALSNLERLRRSKSCGEGRACQPSVDFDLWSAAKPDNNHMQQRMIFSNPNNTTESQRQGEEENTLMFNRKLKEDYKINEGRPESYEDKFKCGALCLFLPSFGGKAKAVRARSSSKDHQMEMMRHMDSTTNYDVSRRVSLEKFECGSWRSSAVINYEELDGDHTTSSTLFFDLPVELIRCSTVNDTESPVTTAFLFDNSINNNTDNHQRHPPKGVLKNTTSSRTGGHLPAPVAARRSQESPNSSRHVRFSTSSPTHSPLSPASSCISPHDLHKVREQDDFNAFLEA